MGSCSVVKKAKQKALKLSLTVQGNREEISTIFKDLISLYNVATVETKCIVENEYRLPQSQPSDSPNCNCYTIHGIIPRAH